MHLSLEYLYIYSFVLIVYRFNINAFPIPTIFISNQVNDTNIMKVV